MKPTVEEKKQFVLHNIAATSLKYVISSCKQILEGPISETDPTYEAITLYIHILYGRPFNNNWGYGKLNTDFIPEALKEVHMEIMKYRDKMYAHNDKGFEHEHFGPVNDLRVTIGEDGWCNYWAQPNRPTHFQIKEILKLATELNQKIEYWKNKFSKKFKNEMPTKPGEYIFNTENEKSILIKRDTELVKKELINIERKINSS